MVKIFFSKLALLIYSILLVLFFVVIKSGQWNEIQQIRARTFDVYNRILPRERAESGYPVRIVDVDEKSLKQYGQWPWSRKLIAELISALKVYNIKVFTIDAFFPEYDRASPQLLASEFKGTLSEELTESLSTLPSYETIMAESMKELPVALGIIGVDDGLESANIEGFESSIKGWRGANPITFTTAFSRFLGSVPELNQAASGIGVFSLKLYDEVFRRAPLLVASQDKHIYPSLSLETLRLGLGSENLFVNSDQNGIRNIILDTKEVGSINIQTDQASRIWIYYATPSEYNVGYRNDVLYVSAADVLAMQVEPEILKDKFVFLGSSSAGLKDLRPTPLTPSMPGVEIHTNVLENILTESYLIEPENIQVIEFAVLLLAGIVVVILTRFVPFIVLFISVSIMISVNIFAGWYLFSNYRYLYDPIYNSFAIFVVFAFTTSLNFIRENYEKRFIRHAFQHYISPELVKELSNSHDKLELGGELRDMSFLFCDIQGFTAISEKFKKDPQGLTQLINRLLTPLTNDILKNNGTIDKYMGDCIMAFWNAPLRDDHHAKNAVLAAMDMQEVIKQINEEVGDNLKIAAGIGVNSGEAVVGNVGSEQRFDYSVLGDPVNLASRLEGQTRFYGVGNIVGGSTKLLIEELNEKDHENHLHFLELDKIAVKGKTVPVLIYTCARKTDKNQKDWIYFIAEHKRFLAAYRDKKWDQAINMTRNLIDISPINLSIYYKMLQDRINSYKENPPPDNWDGTYVSVVK